MAYKGFLVLLQNGKVVDYDLEILGSIFVDTDSPD